jgi:hypothetical protein
MVYHIVCDEAGFSRGVLNMPKVKLDIEKLLGYTEKRVGTATQLSKLAGSKIGISGKGGRPGD